MQTNSVSRDVIAHHEAGHGVAGLVLGVPFTEVRIVPGEDGRIGVPLKTNPWTGPRPASNPGEFTDEEWKELSRSDEKWEAWKRRDQEKYAIFCLAGKAAQFEYAGTTRDEDAKADYSFVQHWLPNYEQRLGGLEQAARALVREHWVAVGAIGAALLERSVLTPAEVEGIFHQAMPEVRLVKAQL
jgi:hypothetical protein